MSLRPMRPAESGVQGITSFSRSFVQQIRGYTLLETVLKKAPQAHILTTKGVGTLTINDPLLKALNNYLLRSKDMTWQSFWRQAEATLGRNPRCMDYVPLDKNAGAVFLTAYRSFTYVSRE